MFDRRLQLTISY